MEHKTVVIADDNKELVLMISKYLELNGYEIASTFSSGTELLNYLKNNTVDILLLDIFMPKCDGINVLEKMSSLEIYKRPKSIIVMTAFNNEALIKRTSVLGVDYFIIKPIELSNLLSAIKSLNTKKDNIKEEDTLMSTIKNNLSTLGIPSHLKGFNFLSMAIYLSYNDLSLLESITKCLYPAVASYYNATSSSVERAMRNAIDLTWANESNAKNIEYYLGPVITFNKKPTNGEFISRFLNFLRVNQLNKNI